MGSLIINQQPFRIGHPKDMCCSPLSSFGDDFSLLLNQTTISHNCEYDKDNKPALKMKVSEEENDRKPVPTTGNVKKQNLETDPTTEDKMVRKSGDTKYIPKCKIPEDILQKYGSKSDISKTNDSGGVKKKKVKKWKPMGLEDLGINNSLFPRPVKEHIDTDVGDNLEEMEREWENYIKMTDFNDKIYYKIENECDEMEKITEKFEKYQDMEGCHSGNSHMVRVDRDRKIMKAHKQVKTKHCASIKNNKGRKRFYIHHRVYKLMLLEITRSENCLPSRKKEKIELRREEIKSGKTKCGKYNTPGTVAPHAPPQSLAHTLDNYNAPSDIDNAIVNILIGLQHRDLTPEDYDLLLRLDESVAPKTISQNTLDKFKTEVVDDSIAGEHCPICMECYEIGQKRKFLPCNHAFHAGCIEMWLNNSSVNCPIDNLPVDPS